MGWQGGDLGGDNLLGHFKYSKVGWIEHSLKTSFGCNMFFFTIGSEFQ